MEGNNALIQDCDIGLDGKYAILTQAVLPGQETIEVDRPIPLGARIHLSSKGESLRNLFVISVSGDGPFTLGVKRNSRGDAPQIMSPILSVPRSPMLRSTPY